MTDKISDDGYVEVGPTSASLPHLKPVGAGALLLHAIQAGRHITTAEIEFALAEERRAGRQWAIDTLRDSEAWAKYCAERVLADGEQRISIWQPREAADFLESLSDGSQT